MTEKNEQNLNQTAEETLDEVLLEEPLKKDQDEIRAEATLRDFYNRFLPGVTEQLKERTDDLKSRWDAADQMSLLLFRPFDLNKLPSDQQKAYKEKIARKIKIYDAIKKTGINLYGIERTLFLRKARKVRDNLGSNLESYMKELKGKAYLNVSADLYANLLSNLPEHIKSEDRYSNLVKWLTDNAGVPKNGGGLKTELRDLGQQARYLTDIDDLLEATITSYDIKMESTSNEIKDLDKQLAKDPGDSKIMEERAKKTALYNQYEIERDNYFDSREDVFNQLMDIKANYVSTEQRMGVKEVSALKTRKVLRRLESAVKHYELYGDTRKEMTTVVQNLKQVEKGYDYADVLEVAAQQGDSIATQQYENIMERDKKRENESIPTNGGRDWKSLANNIRSQQREEMEDFKKKIKSSMYV
ncbi:hypothetical protein HQ533_04270 [Candidatus Woesearchaeota archaeon]|nr:hypothetical protein [Candidatus Woesearchaeota archaeon]